MNICKKCKTEFEPSKGLVNYCSLQCRNSRTWSLDDIKKKRESANKSVKVKQCNKARLILSNKARYVSRVYRKCKGCDEYFTTTKSRNRIYHSYECFLKSAGGYRHGSGRGKAYVYNGANLDSSWELEFVKYLDSQNIKWIRNTKRFYFTWKNKKTYYIPDFYLPEQNRFVEIKGYWFGDKKERTMYAILENKLNVLIIENKNYKTVHLG